MNRKLPKPGTRIPVRILGTASYGCHPGTDRTRIQIEIIATAPSVVYHVHLTNGEMVPVDNPSLLPEAVRIKHIEEPYIKATIMVPAGYIGPVMELARQAGNFFGHALHRRKTGHDALRFAACGSRL